MKETLIFGPEFDSSPLVSVFLSDWTGEQKQNKLLPFQSVDSRWVLADWCALSQLAHLTLHSQ